MGTIASEERHDVTRLLRKMAAGDAEAANLLIPLIYRDLRKIASHYLRKERIGHTLQPTALVHEAYLRIVGMQKMTWENRAHFVSVAATLMRHILIDYARRRNARAEGYVDAGRDEFIGRMGTEQAREMVALDDALTNLAELDPRQTRIVELRFFGGLSVDEIAHVLNLSSRTV
jgi:RNA polymerase sigma factor (TIGR02999 family)